MALLLIAALDVAFLAERAELVALAAAHRIRARLDAMREAEVPVVDRPH
jgi:hypothetical protein